ncbi:MAG: right-handed parallel beta-helix repeat-containing protein, partial [Flavobacterium sp.]
SLFTSSIRLQRANSDTFLTKSPLPKFINSFKRYDFKSAQSIIKDSIEGFCGFTYNNKDLDNLKYNSGTEINLYHSWETSWHTICNIDTSNKTIIFKNPSTYPVGFFSNHLRYIVENSIQFLSKPGRWYLDIENGELYYYANLGENPNNMFFIIPKLQELISLKGNPSQLVNNISFFKINFTHTTIPSGIHEVASATKIPNADYFPCLDLQEGFSSLQAALGAGQSILLKYANNCSFVKCGFTQLGNYAIRIGEYSIHNTILQCNINDCSGGGVLIGFDNCFISINSYKENSKTYVTSDRKYTVNRNLPVKIAPSYNLVRGCSIYNCGLYFTSSVGIGLMQAHHNRIENNTICDLPYSGISVGWDYDFKDNFTSYNSIKNNTIHD